ncbi:anti-sigma factor [Kosakonia cowanii]|uniref:anti-sigma factor family protein n=1 Tax=Kosakonia cowanii TaxID=208223 RepID=UPI00320B6739
MTLPPDEHDLHAWLDGETDEATSARIEHYLAQNPQAAREVAGWRQDAQRLRQAMDRHSATLEMPEPRALRRQQRQVRQWKLTTAFALVMALGVGGFTGWQLKESQMVLAHAPMEDAVQAYKLFDNTAITPMDVATTQQTELTHWVGRYFINGNQPPNLEQYGFTLVGARLVATAQGPAALIMYQDPRGTRVGWYIRPLSPGKLPHGERKAEDVMTQYWSDDHYNYALVTPLNSPAVNGLRKAVSQANS